MQLKFKPMILSGLLLVAACGRNPVHEEQGQLPRITNLMLNYSQLNRTLFIAAEIEDPQGWSDVDSVVFRLFRLPAADAASGTLFLQGHLLDDGTAGDIIKRDNVYSYLVAAPTLNGNEGYYRVEVQAFDAAGHSSVVSTKDVLVQANTPPTLFLLEGPSSFEKGDTLKFRLRVTDLQGYSDIAGVIYTVKQPTGKVVTHSSFILRDDGQFGDAVARDGVFTVWQPSNRQSRLQGLFVFNFFARDYHGATSDTLRVAVRNPGLTVTYPDSVAAITAGSQVNITWQSAYIDQVKIEYTTEAHITNPTYNLISTMPAAVGVCSWSVPNQSYDHCRIRITDTTNPERTDLSDLEFKIQP